MNLKTLTGEAVKAAREGDAMSQVWCRLNDREFGILKSFLESIIARTAKEVIEAVRVEKNEEYIYYEAEFYGGYHDAIDEAVEKAKKFLNEG